MYGCDGHLEAVRQDAVVSPAVLAQPQSLLLGFGLLGPGQAQRGGEQEASLQAPVGRELGADWRSD